MSKKSSSNANRSKLMSIVATITTKKDQLKQFFMFSESYLRRNNPALSLYQNFIAKVKELLTMDKKLKIAKYRLNHVSYRLYQMETLIEQGNPNNLNKGKNLNYLR